jgi:putative ABC transport system permease protein
MRRLTALELQVTTADELIAKIRKQTDMLAVLLTAIGSISLLVGGVGIMNIMLVSVSERRQEIGILRALGAKRQHIRAQFLTEALLLSFIGGIIGIVLSLVVTYYVAAYNTWQFFISFEPILLGASISIFIGVFFGFFPAHQAAALDPIKALRGE